MVLVGIALEQSGLKSAHVKALSALKISALNIATKSRDVPGPQ
jgi:hypothetical protein